MGGGLKTRGIESTSGYTASVNSSGQLAVEAIVSVGAVTTGVSGQTIYISATEVSGTNPFIYVTQSGQAVSGIPHRLVVAFSGDTTIAKISGETVVAQISGQPVLTSVSGNIINTSVSGNFVRITGETIIGKISGETVSVGGIPPVVSRLAAVDINNNFNFLGTDVVNGTRLKVATSGDTVIALISGQTVVAEVDLQGATIEVGDIEVDINGQTVIAKVSGESVRFGASGFSYTHVRAFDYDAGLFRDAACTVSGNLRVNASVTADISGQTVRTFVGSGQNAAYLTNRSGNLEVIVDASGRLCVTNSGAVLNVLSGTGVRVSGETLNVTSGTGVRVSGEAVKISGDTVIGKVSGEMMGFWHGSGRNGAYLTNRSGSLEVIVDTSGRMAVTNSGVTVIAKVSGEVVNVSGNAVVTSVSGNVVVAKISGETVVTSVSGNSVTATTTVSGNIPIASLATISGVALLTVEPTKTFFMAYQTMMIHDLSGGAELLSGDSRVVTIKNIGQSGTVMFVGSSGTSRAPYVMTQFSGWGYQLKDGDSITIGCWNPAVLRVVCLTSGQAVSYAINNY